MSSIHRSPRTTAQGNDYFVNIADVVIGTDTFSYNETANTVATYTPNGLSGTDAAGTLLVKDMGKTVTVSGDQYRKVATANTDTVFYIKLVPATGSACKFARMTLQA
jgi:hypothetical protein